MSVISQKIDEDTSFTAPSDCVVSIIGTIAKGDSVGISGTLSICSVKVLSGSSDGKTYFEYKGIVLKKNDEIAVTDGASAHISGFTIEG